MTKEIVSIFVHYRANASLECDNVFIASHVAQELLLKDIKRKGAENLLDFMSVWKQGGLEGVIQSLVLDSCVHSSLPRGGILKIRRLVDYGTSHRDNIQAKTLSIHMLPAGRTISALFPVLPTETFYDDDGVRNAADNVYLQPAVNQYTSIDAIVKLNMLFQVITPQMHPCTLEALQKVAKLITPSQNLQLFFVLPPELFCAYEYQMDLSYIVVDSIHANKRRAVGVQQFALEYSFARNNEIDW